MLNSIIVDDEKNARELLKVMLKEHCPQVNVMGSASNITDAYDLIITHSPQIVFLDIEMPGGSGFELLKKFEKKNFLVVFVTAHNQYSNNADLCMDFLFKPLDEWALINTVKKAEKSLNGFLKI